MAHFYFSVKPRDWTLGHCSPRLLHKTELAWVPDGWIEIMELWGNDEDNIHIMVKDK